MNLLIRHRKIVGISLFIILAILIRFKIILFGLPYSMHADETYVYKDPLKILLLFKDLNFSQPYNLVNWLLAVWTGIIFVIGYIFGQWPDFNTFRDLLLLEDGKIIFAYRVLSLLASISGNVILYRLCTGITTNGILKILFALTFLLNPVELLSDNWIKYDAYVFLSFCILLNYSYSCFFLSREDAVKKLYLFSIIAISVRIEFISFFISILLYDGYNNYLTLGRRDFITNIKKKSVYILKGTLVYCIITFFPVNYIYNYLYPVSANVGITKPFEKVISSRLMDYFYSGTLFQNITKNFLFYFNTCFLALGPVIIICIAFFFIKMNRARYLFLFMIFTGAVLLLYGAFGTHYFLTMSVIFIFGSCVFISQLRNIRLQIIYALFNLVYVSTVSFSFLAAISFSRDPRLEAADYISENISPSDLIAMETHSMNGLGPPLNECKDILLKKSEIIAEIGGGTGETYRLKANNAAGTCWKILDIFSTDYFAGSAYEKTWINTYDKDLLARGNPEYYITTRSLQQTKPEGGMLPANSQSIEFYDYIKSNYTLLREFKCAIFDPRLPYLLNGGLYLRPVRIYKKNKNQ
ncbi:MAG: hypothetical protein HYY40_03615 [Bacteroidetes bacterium]|nr:hypothetical protein [Bacteroidota bacterium]